MRVQRSSSFHVVVWAAASATLFGCNGLSGASDVSIDAASAPTGGSAAAADGEHAVLPTTTLNCAYAPTDPGVTDGKQLPSSLSWQGYVAGRDGVVTLSSTDFYDCDGSKGVDVVVYEMAKFFCGSCEQDAATVEARLAAWRAKGYGVEWVTALVTGTDGQSPPSVDAAKVWRDKHGFSTVHVVADPGYSLLPQGKSSFGTPSYVIVDPRTQKVVAWMEGLGGQDPVVEATAAKNLASP